LKISPEIADNIKLMEAVIKDEADTQSQKSKTALFLIGKLKNIDNAWTRIAVQRNKLLDGQRKEVLKKLYPITELSQDYVGKNLTVTKEMLSAMKAFIDAKDITEKALEGNADLKTKIDDAIKILNTIKSQRLDQVITYWDNALESITDGAGDRQEAFKLVTDYNKNRATIIADIDQLIKLGHRSTIINNALKRDIAGMTAKIKALENSYMSARQSFDSFSNDVKEKNLKLVGAMIDFYFDNKDDTANVENLTKFQSDIRLINQAIRKAELSGAKSKPREEFDNKPISAKINFVLQDPKNKLGVTFEDAIKDAKLADWQKKELIKANTDGYDAEAISDMANDMMKRNEADVAKKVTPQSELAEQYKFLYRGVTEAADANEIAKLPNANERFQELIDIKHNANRAENSYKKMKPEAVTALQESMKQNTANIKKAIDAEIRKNTIKEQTKAMDKLAGEMRKASPEKPIQRDATGKRIFTPNNNAEIKQQDVLAQDGKTVKKIASYATEDGSVTTIAPDASLTNFATTKSQMKQDLSDMAKAVANFLPNYEKELGFSQEQKDRLLEEYKIASDYFAKMQQAYVENNANDKDGFYHYMRLLEKQLLKKKEADTALKSEEEDTLKQVQTYENAINGLIANLKLTVAGKSSSYQDLVTNAINQMLELQKDFTEANRVKVKEIYDATISQGNIILGTKASVVNEITNMMMVLSEKSRASVNGYQKNELLGVIAQLTNLKDSLDIDKARALFNQYKDVQPIVSDVAVQPPVPAVNTPADNKS
jgi:hypothetical protein